MKIFISGENSRVVELKKIIPSQHELFFSREEISASDLIIDLNLDDEPKKYSTDKFVIGCAVKKNLQQLNPENSFRLVGMNLLPTFIFRSKQEMSFANEKEEKNFAEIAAELNWSVMKVNDYVGMVTPRIISMIINEACFTLERGTATIEDIDKGMKLGTAYPLGPFEWCNKIGVKNVYEILDAIYNDTHDERYKICSLLKEHYTNKQLFLL